jgi:hypothetical protein
MAACELKIQLDDPQRPRTGGESVKGAIRVKTTERVKCSALEVSSFWSTHGRGNVERGEVDSAVLFQGEWEPVREYEYPFQLKSAAWPPSYYGTYLNVGHYIGARAKVPWSFDPKTQVEFTVVATAAPDDLKPEVSANRRHTLGSAGSSGSYSSWSLARCLASCCCSSCRSWQSGARVIGSSASFCRGSIPGRSNVRSSHRV